MENFSNSNRTDTPILLLRAVIGAPHNQRVSSPRKQKVHQTNENITAKFCRRCSVTTDNIKKVLCRQTKGNRTGAMRKTLIRTTDSLTTTEAIMGAMQEGSETGCHCSNSSKIKPSFLSTTPEKVRDCTAITIPAFTYPEQNIRNVMLWRLIATNRMGGM